MRDGSGIVAGVAVENKILVAGNFASFVRQKRRCINLKGTVGALKFYRQKIFVERDFLSLAKLHRLTSKEIFTRTF